MQHNRPSARTRHVTHESGPAQGATPLQELRRTVLACLLWEDTFYEDGVSVAERIKRLVPKCKQQDVADLAIEMRTKHNLRHAPLLLVRELARLPHTHDTYIGVVRDTLVAVIQRPDEITEFVSLYWKDSKCPLSRQVKAGLADAFAKFNEYSLAKYNRDTPIKLRDVMFLVHPKPKDDETAVLFKKLADNTLATPDTWEVALSAGADKRETFTRLMAEGKLGALALLRNLRKMLSVGVDVACIREALASADCRRVLPFRYIAAARAVPQLEPVLDTMMQAALADLPKLLGSTVIVVDVSGSMYGAKISAKSDLDRAAAAGALAVLVRGVCDDVRVFTFSSQAVEVPPRCGMGLVDAITKSQAHNATYMKAALARIHLVVGQVDRVIVITDEQSHDGGYEWPGVKGYMLNVGTYKNGVQHGDWTCISGFSEQVVSYIMTLEAENAASVG